MGSSYRIQSGFRASLLGRVLSHRVFWVALILLAIAAAGVALGIWAFGKWTNRQSWKFAVAAANYRAEGKFSEALMSAQTSLRLNPENPTALRELARLFAISGSKKASLMAWQRLAEIGGLNPRDLTDYVLLAGAEREWDTAGRIIDRLQAAYPGADVHLLHSRILDMKGDVSGAKRELRTALALDKTSRSRMALALFLLDRRRDASTDPEILELLREVGRDSGPLGSMALSTGLSRGIVPAREMPDWITALRSHANAQDSQLLLADSAEVSLDGALAPLVAAKVYARLKTKPLGSRREGFFWLSSNRQNGLALKLVAPEEARTETRLFKAWLDASASEGQLESIQEALNRPEAPLPSYWSSLYRARTLRLLGAHAEARAIFEEQLAEHAENPAVVREIIQYLQSVGEDEVLEAELDRILSKKLPPEGLAYQDLLPVIASGRDLERLHRFNRLAFQHASWNAMIENEYNYTSLVRGEEVDREALALRVDKYPTHIGIRTTQALYFLWDKMPAKAQTALLAAPSKSKTSPLEAARHAFVQALVHAETGDKQGFRKTLAKIDPKLLTKQEITRLRLARNSLFTDWMRIGNQPTESNEKLE